MERITRSRLMKKFTDLSLRQYLEELSSSQPVPGGGSVSAYTASLAMGLTLMVGRVALGRKIKAGLSPEDEKKEKTNRELIQKILDAISKTQQDAFQIVDLDPEVFNQIMAISADDAKMEAALHNSFRLQADLALLVVMAREWNQEMFGAIKGSIKNDLLVAASLYEAAYYGAHHTAMINVKYMKDPSGKQHAEEALQKLQERFNQGSAHVH